MRPSVDENQRRLVTSKFDVTSYLKSPGDIAGYLDAWLLEAPEDTIGIAKALGEVARAQGMTHVARGSGLSRESLYRSLAADGNPSFSTVQKVMRALGVRLRVEPIDP